MSDVDTGATAPTAQADPTAIYTVPLKADCGEVQIDLSRLSDDVYRMVVLEGLKAVINSVGMSKKLPGITKLEGAEKAKAQAEVVKQAQENVDALYAGTINKRGKAAKVGGPVKTEAMRLAKAMVKDLIRNSGQKVGAYSAKEITAAATKVLEANPELIKTAEKNLANRAAEAKHTGGLDLTAMFGAKAQSDEVKAKPKVAPKRKAKADAPLSAKQAGLVAPRQKPTGATAH